MKRSPQLRDLSEQHHYGLVAARHLKQAAEGKKPLGQVLDLFGREWEREIQPHFAAEEEVLLPAFAEAAGSDHSLIARTLAEHAALREAVGRALAADGEGLQDLAGEIGTALHDHIRFEERELFPAIEVTLEGAALEELGRRLHERAMPVRACAVPGEGQEPV